MFRAFWLAATFLLVECQLPAFNISEVEDLISDNMEYFGGQREDRRDTQFAFLLLLPSDCQLTDFRHSSFLDHNRRVRVEGPRTNPRQVCCPQPSRAYNFMCARVDKRPSRPNWIHTETSLLDGLPTMWNNYLNANDGTPPAAILLYTYHLPCFQCTDDIVGVLGGEPFRSALRFVGCSNAAHSTEFQHFFQSAVDNNITFVIAPHRSEQRSRPTIVPLHTTSSQPATPIHDELLRKRRSVRPKRDTPSSSCPVDQNSSFQDCLLDCYGGPEVLGCCARDKVTAAQMFIDQMLSATGDAFGGFFLTNVPACILRDWVKTHVGKDCSCLQDEDQLVRKTDECVRRCTNTLPIYFRRPLTARDDLGRVTETFCNTRNDPADWSTVCDGLIQTHGKRAYMKGVLCSHFHRTVHGRACRPDHKCELHGEEYYWCYLEGGGWDHCCAPGSSCRGSYSQPDTCAVDASGIGKIVVPCGGKLDVTVTNTRCRNDHRCSTHGKGYHWCYTDDSWDYCCNPYSSESSTWKGRFWCYTASFDLTAKNLEPRWEYTTYLYLYESRRYLN